MDLFSEDSEKARLQVPIVAPKSQKPVEIDDSYVFQGIQSPD